MNATRTEAPHVTGAAVPPMIPLSKWNDFFPYPTTPALRSNRINDPRNFNARCLRRIGGRLYVLTAEFWQWAKEEAAEAAGEEEEEEI